ncbi:hypothetical protein [Algoriphagus boritolerans]
MINIRKSAQNESEGVFRNSLAGNMADEGDLSDGYTLRKVVKVG